MTVATRGLPSTPDRHETEPDLTIRHDDDGQPCRACGRPATYEAEWREAYPDADELTLRRLAGDR